LSLTFDKSKRNSKKGELKKMRVSTFENGGTRPVPKEARNNNGVF